MDSEFEFHFVGAGDEAKFGIEGAGARHGVEGDAAAAGLAGGGDEAFQDFSGEAEAAVGGESIHIHDVGGAASEIGDGGRKLLVDHAAGGDNSTVRLGHDGEKFAGGDFGGKELSRPAGETDGDGSCGVGFSLKGEAQSDERGDVAGAGEAAGDFTHRGGQISLAAGARCLTRTRELRPFLRWSSRRAGGRSSTEPSSKPQTLRKKA